MKAVPLLAVATLIGRVLARTRLALFFPAMQSRCGK
jgi:hypothetical protein